MLSKTSAFVFLFVLGGILSSSFLANGAKRSTYQSSVISRLHRNRKWQKRVFGTDDTTKLLNIESTMRNIHLSSITLGEDSKEDVNIFSLHPVYHQIHTYLRTTSLSEVSTQAFDLSSYTPFCTRNGTITPVMAPQLGLGVSVSCVRWEELELDMLLMYIDLIAVGMARSLAEEFYRQVRCLSRANVRVVERTQQWEVCFSFDFSMHVGTLLAHYIKLDVNLNPPVKSPSPLPSTVSRMGEAKSANTSLPGSTRQTSTLTSLLLLFQLAESFRLYRDSNTDWAKFNELVKTSCCKSCADPNYFVNIEDMSCVSDPFGKHCCHTACKSLRHLRVGVATSIYYCCTMSNPQRCVQENAN